MLKDIKKIAILRANALGDFIVTLPAITAIRNKFPLAELILLGKPWHKKFLIPGRSPINRVIVIPVKKGIRDEINEPENTEKQELFFREMQNEQFDIAVHFQGNGISANSFINRFNAGLTVGLTTETAAPLDKSIQFNYYQSEVLRYIEVAALLGAKTSEIEPQINVLDTDKEEIKGLLSFIDKPFVVLHAMANDIRRSWPEENFIPLANWLKEKNLEVVFTGLKEDFNKVDNIISSMKFSAINACGTLSLGGLSALFSRASLAISADTGPLHLARAVNTPTVGIYWAPNLINWGPLSRAFHRPVISWNMECPYCGIIPNEPYPFEPQSTCDHKISFVRDVSIAAVCEAAESLLFKTKTPVKNENFSVKN